MGLFDFVSPALTVASEAQGAQQVGQQQANARVTNDALERLKVMQLMRQQQSTQDLNKARIAELMDRAGGAPTGVTLPSPSDAIAMTMGGGAASAAAPTQSAGTVTVPSLPRDVRDANLRSAATAAQIAQRGIEARETQAAKPQRVQFVPGATPGTVVTPSEGGGPPKAAVLGGVQPKAPTPRAANPNATTASERALTLEKRQAASEVARLAAEYARDQIDANGITKRPGMPPAQAQQQAESDVRASGKYPHVYPSAAPVRAGGPGARVELPGKAGGAPVVYPHGLPPSKGPTQQQKDYDLAAAAAKAQGLDPVKLLGPRP